MESGKREREIRHDVFRSLFVYELMSFEMLCQLELWLISGGFLLSSTSPIDRDWAEMTKTKKVE